MFRHALCVYPYRRELGSVNFFPPLGLESIAAVLEPHCDAIDVVDLRKEPGRTRDFLRPETDLVCFSVNWDRDIKFIHEEIQSVPAHVLTVIGGRHVTVDPEPWLATCPNIDAAVRGDGEEAIEEFCRGMPLGTLAGVSARVNGRVIHNGNRTPGSLSDDIYPRRRLRRQPYGVAVNDVTTGLLIDTISSSRGCPFNCTFCSFNRNPWGTKRNWSARSPESVVRELAEIEAPIVGFTDDLFTFDMDRVEAICNLILERGIKKKYIINARLEIARRPQLLRLMERAGFMMLLLGIESAHDKTLRSMHKGFDTAKIREWCSELRRTSMVMHGYFILGNIGESLEEMRQILPFARELGLDTIAISTLRASPYSGLDELVAQSPGYHIAPNGKIYSDHCSVEELREMRRRMYREFFSAGRMLHLLRKGIKLGALAYLPVFLPSVPRILWSAVTSIRSGTRRRARRRHALAIAADRTARALPPEVAEAP